MQNPGSMSKYKPAPSLLTSAICEKNNDFFGFNAGISVFLHKPYYTLFVKHCWGCKISYPNVTQSFIVPDRSIHGLTQQQ